MRGPSSHVKGDPVSETAHYVAVVRSGSTDLYLVQQGRVEAPGLVPIRWERPAAARAERPEPRGPLAAARRRAARIISNVVNVFLA